MKKLLRSEKFRPVILIAALAAVIALNAAAAGLGRVDLSPAARPPSPKRRSKPCAR